MSDPRAAADYRRKAEEAARLASRTYSPVEYGEYMKVSETWLALARAAERDSMPPP